MAVAGLAVHFVSKTSTEAVTKGIAWLTLNTVQLTDDRYMALGTCKITDQVITGGGSDKKVVVYAANKSILWEKSIMLG